MDPHLDSDIEIHRDVLGVDRGWLRMVDGDNLVLGNVVLRTCSDLQYVIMRHLSFVSRFAFSMHKFLMAHVVVSRNQQSVGK
jgi:hypothetical protein